MKTAIALAFGLALGALMGYEIGAKGQYEADRKSMEAIRSAGITAVDDLNDFCSQQIKEIGNAVRELSR